ncbi:MAG: rRNA methyltransferase [Acidobacteria bacterium]|nr:rRNA methyltransferase [Acidobacteriota bacterium]
MSQKVSPARGICYQLLGGIESGRLHSDDALNSPKMLQLDVRDRHLTTEVVYGTLRWQALLDYVLSAASARPWPKVQSGAKILLRMSLYQMWKMDRVPEYALVNDAVELAKRELGRGVEGYVNGVLRHLARAHSWEDEDFLRQAPRWVQASLPEWLFKRWSARYGESAAMDFALSLNRPPRAAVRGVPEAGSDVAFPFPTVKSDLVPGAFIRVEAADDGLPEGVVPPGCRFQDEASQLIPHLLQPQRGWRVWDACAAPGGKSAILGGICGEAGRVVASDLRSERIARLAQFLEASGVHNADVLVADARRPSPFRRVFDGVLADVPCSGLGTLRRNPEIKWHFREKEFTSRQEMQQKILSNVSESVRAGGRLLYSTCSTEPEENEQIVGDFLETHPEFSLQRPSYPPGIEKYAGEDAMVRTYPGTRLWDGFFAALMVRRP